MTLPASPMLTDRQAEMCIYVCQERHGKPITTLPICQRQSQKACFIYRTRAKTQKRQDWTSWRTIHSQNCGLRIRQNVFRFCISAFEHIPYISALDSKEHVH